MLTLRSTRLSQPQGPAEIDRRNPITKGIVIAASLKTARYLRVGTSGVTPGGVSVCGTATLLQKTDSSFTVANSTVASLEYYSAAPSWDSAAQQYTDNARSWPSDTGLMVSSPKVYGVAALSARNSGGAAQSFSSPRLYRNLVVGDTLHRVFVVGGDLLITAYRRFEGKTIVDTGTAFQGATFNTAAAQNVMQGDTAEPGTHILLTVRWNNRALSAGEVCSFLDNPWQIFQ